MFKPVTSSWKCRKKRSFTFASEAAFPAVTGVAILGFVISEVFQNLRGKDKTLLQTPVNGMMPNKYTKSSWWVCCRKCDSNRCCDKIIFWIPRGTNMQGSDDVKRRSIWTTVGGVFVAFWWKWFVIEEFAGILDWVDGESGGVRCGEGYKCGKAWLRGRHLNRQSIWVYMYGFAHTIYMVERCILNCTQYDDPDTAKIWICIVLFSGLETGKKWFPDIGYQWIRPLY